MLAQVGKCLGCPGAVLDRRCNNMIEATNFLFEALLTTLFVFSRCVTLYDQWHLSALPDSFLVFVKSDMLHGASAEDALGGIDHGSA